MKLELTAESNQRETEFPSQGHSTKNPIEHVYEWISCDITQYKPSVAPLYVGYHILFLTYVGSCLQNGTKIIDLIYVINQSF